MKRRNSLQPALIQPLPEGVTLLRNMLDRKIQERLRDAARNIAFEAPLYTPTMRGGTEFNLSITSCGNLGWTSDHEGYRYIPHHPTTKKAWPTMPSIIHDIAHEAAEAAGFSQYSPQTCLINYYRAGHGRLGMHQDKTERDHTSPIVTISLGDTAIFAVGGLYANSPAEHFPLHSGDVLVMGGAGRMLFHEVKEVVANTSDLLRGGGRISLTLRRVTIE